MTRNYERDFFEDVKNRSCLAEVSDIKFKYNREIVEQSICRLDLRDYPLHQLDDMVDYLYDEEIHFADIEEAIAYFTGRQTVH